MHRKGDSGLGTRGPAISNPPHQRGQIMDQVLPTQHGELPNKDNANHFLSDLNGTFLESVGLGDWVQLLK